MAAAPIFQLSRAVPIPLYSLHCEDIDIQHRRIGQLLQDVADRIQEGMGAEVVGKTFIRVVEYMRVHFGDEEQFMEAWRYPAPLLREHALEHARMMERLEKLHAGIGTANPPTRTELVEPIVAWLEFHRASDDKPYMEYCRAAWRADAV